MISISSLLAIFLVLLIFVTLFLFKKNSEQGVYISDLLKEKQKMYSDISKIKHDAQEQTTEIITKTTQKNIKQSTLFLKIKKIVSSFDPDEICNNVFDILVKELGVTKACILLLNERKHVYTVLSSIGFMADEQSRIVISPHENSLIGMAIRSNLLVDIKTIERDQSFQALVHKGTLKTLMAAPLHHSKSSEIMAVLNICEMQNASNYSTDDKHLFNMVASLLEVAFNNSLIYETQIEESQKNAEEREKLKDVFGRYVSSQIIDEILKNADSIELGGVSKQVTILASDIRSFSTMSEVFTAQEMVAMLNDYFSVMTEIVNINHGCVDKFIGDAMMVLFGAPLKTPDDNFNAIRCALEMQDAIKIFENKWREIKGNDLNFKIGIGINTGEVIIGNIGSSSRMEYTAIGDNVNVAFRLEEIAPGGTIFITESFYNEIKDKVNVKKLDPVTVKGRTKSVQVYEVLSLK